MRIDAISIGKNPPHDVNVIIEVPVGGEPIKYEMDKDAGTLVVDRFLYTAMRYPGNYGFIPHTLSGDGDPCDVLVANTRAIVPGAVMSVRPVGVLLMEDNAGIDEHANRDGDAGEAHDVRRHAGVIHPQERQQHGERQRDGDDQDRPEVHQEDDVGERDEGNLFQERHTKRIDRLIDQALGGADLG